MLARILGSFLLTAAAGLLGSGCATFGSHAHELTDNPLLHDLEHTSFGTASEHTGPEWTAIVRSALERGEVQKVVEGQGWLVAQGLAQGPWVDIEWHFGAQGLTAVLGRPRADFVPGGTLAQQAQAMELELKALSVDPRDLDVNAPTGVMYRHGLPPADCQGDEEGRR